MMTSGVRYLRLPAVRRLLSWLSALLLLLSIHNPALSTPVPAARNFSGEFTQGTLIAVNQGDRDISLIDPNTGAEFGRIPVGAITGHEVATSLDGRLAFVPIYGNSIPGKPGTDGNEVVVIDLVIKRVLHRVRFSHGVRPHCIVMDPRDGLLYVTTELDNTVSIIDPRTFAILGSIPTGRPQSHMLVLSHDGRFGYTANIESGTVSVLDLRERKLIDVISVSRQVQRISISPNDNNVFTADQTQPRLAIINAVNRTLRGWIPLPEIGYGSGSTPDGTRLLVTLPNSARVAVINQRSLKIEKLISVPEGPHEVLISPDGTTAYIACITAGAVAMIDLKTSSVKHVTKVGKLCDGIGWSTRTVEKAQQ